VLEELLEVELDELELLLDEVELDELLLEDELEELDDELLEDELDELELLLEEDELLELPVVVGAYEHQAEVIPEYAPPKFELEQATLLVKVPNTKLPDLPKATWRVPLKEQVAPVFCAHLVYPSG
jgi:hypothetical protein